MKSLPAWIMSSWWQASLLIAATSLLPLANLIGGAALALVTLRLGASWALTALMPAVLLTGVLAIIATGSVMPAVSVTATFWLPIVLLAMTLRITRSLALTLYMALTLVIAGLLIYGVAITDWVEWGRNILNAILAPLISTLAAESPEQALLNQLLDNTAPLVVGVLIAGELTAILFCLLWGRSWQAHLFNPGGFRSEFQELRLGQSLALVALATFGVALWGGSLWINNLALPLTVIYSLQGLAIVHGVVTQARLSTGWLIGFYILLVIALVEMLALLCVIGIVDTWIDFRTRVACRNAR